MAELPVVEVEQVSKKFCRRLRYSLWYGLTDLAAELTGRNGKEDLQLRQAEFLAVDDVSFELRPGECIGLIGHNGAGKSTLLKMLNGLIRPDRGRITMRGRVGALIELGAGFSPVLTGRENIYINGAVLGFSKREIDAKFDEIVDFAELHDAIDAPVQTYSSGMYVRLGFAVAAQLNPDILLVDEILAVGDMEFRIKCMNRIWNLLKSGAAVILVSHNMYHIQAFATRAILMENGKIECEGEPAFVVDEYESRVAGRTILLSEPESNGPLRFREIRLSSGDRELANGNEWPAVATNSHFGITVFYELNERVPDGIQIGLLIKNSEGHRVAGFTTGVDGRTLSGEPGKYQIKFDFDNNLLLNGQYYCGLSSFTIDYAQSLGHWEAATKFRVRTVGYNGLSSVGNVFLPHRITVSELRT
jgi:ABC-type polysaccharide/polyol phosphate transport system ATPase subunit